ncbi:MAG: VOC family protein [Proteobacteria bacterium]|nr:VOC family protein [Pseudomonadota bacterium]
MNERSKRMVEELPKAVMPMIVVSSVDDVHRFYTEKLGFKRVMGMLGEDGQLNMVTVMLDGAKLMFTRPRAKTDAAPVSAGRRPVEIYLQVADVDAYHARLRERGVTICDPPTLQWWGDKTFKVMDPSGYEIWFYQKIAGPRPPQGVKIV